MRIYVTCREGCCTGVPTLAHQGTQTHTHTHTHTHKEKETQMERERMDGVGGRDQHPRIYRVVVGLLRDKRDLPCMSQILHS